MKFSECFIKANDKMCDFDNHINAPYFRKSFDLDFIPQKAEITICGLGFYEVYINGENITKGHMAPYISNPDEICYYDNYDISRMLKQGKNVVGVLLGNGLRNAFGGFVWQFHEAKFRGPVITAFCLEAYGEGKEICIEADESVKTAPSAITFNDLRMGYRYDSRLETDDWNMPEFDDSNWQNALIAEKPAGEYKLCCADSIRVTKKLSAIKITHYDSLPFAYKQTETENIPLEDTVRKNVYVYDFGENNAGVTVLKINGKPGQKITIRHGEYPVDDHFAINSTIFDRPGMVERYLEYAQVDEFICKGGEEIFVPKFKYDGFRYAYVEGLIKSQATKDALTYYVMSSDIKRRGNFKCSNEILNKLQNMAARSDISNFFYFPNDCPHREKNGWTGDVSLSAEHILLNFNASRSLKEWLCNIRKVQDEAGRIPDIIPTGGWGFGDGNGPSWDAVIVNLPYYIYKFEGDKEVILENTQMILRYLFYISNKRTREGIFSMGRGDWADPLAIKNNHRSAPLEVVSTLQAIDMVQKAVHLFRETKQVYAEKFAVEFANDLRNAFREQLVDFKDMSVAGRCQTSQAMAIAVGIFDKSEIALARERLVEIIKSDNYENCCGVFGLRYIFHVLCDMNEWDLAYQMIVSEKVTGYGYFVKRGETTLCEGMFENSLFYNSHNHHYMGDFSSLTIQEFAGIKPNPYVDDISYFEISPKFISQLSFAEAEYESKFGTVKSKWIKDENGDVKLTVTVPEGVHGYIKCPEGYTYYTREVLPLVVGENTYDIIKRRNFTN